MNDKEGASRAGGWQSDPQFRDFLRSYKGELEDALLPALAERERADAEDEEPDPPTSLSLVRQDHPEVQALLAATEEVVTSDGSEAEEEEGPPTCSEGPQHFQGFSVEVLESVARKMAAQIKGESLVSVLWLIHFPKATLNLLYDAHFHYWDHDCDLGAHILDSFVDEFLGSLGRGISGD